MLHSLLLFIAFRSKGGCKTSPCHTTVTCAFPATGIICSLGSQEQYLHMKLSLLKSKRIQKDMMNSISSASKG